MAKSHRRRAKELMIIFFFSFFQFCHHVGSD